jgi:hypothetical protein
MWLFLSTNSAWDSFSGMACSSYVCFKSEEWLCVWKGAIQMGTRWSQIECATYKRCINTNTHYSFLLTNARHLNSSLSKQSSDDSVHAKLLSVRCKSSGITILAVRIVITADGVTPVGSCHITRINVAQNSCFTCQMESQFFDEMLRILEITSVRFIDQRFGQGPPFSSRWVYWTRRRRTWLLLPAFFESFIIIKASIRKRTSFSVQSNALRFF